MQTRRMSATETVVSTAIGLAVSWVLTHTVLHFFGYAVNIGHSTGITAIYTHASISRWYLVRWLFHNICE